MKTILALILLMLAGAVGAQRLPSDVLHFVESRDGCDHFRSEPFDLGDEPDVRQRREFLIKKIKELCRGTDKRLEQLQRKYRRNASVIQRLESYERNVGL